MGAIVTPSIQTVYYLMKVIKVSVWLTMANSTLLMIKGFVKHFRINVSDIKIKHFENSMSSLSSSKYMIELIVYIVEVV